MKNDWGQGNGIAGHGRPRAPDPLEALFILVWDSWSRNGRPNRGPTLPLGCAPESSL